VNRLVTSTRLFVVAGSNARNTPDSTGAYRGATRRGAPRLGSRICSTAAEINMKITHRHGPHSSRARAEFHER
jgi:hypothetical protein